MDSLKKILILGMMGIGNWAYGNEVTVYGEIKIGLLKDAIYKAKLSEEEFKELL